MSRHRSPYRLALAAFLVVGFSLGMTGAARASVVIDTFSDVGVPSPWPVELGTVGSLPPIFETGLSGVLGGERETRVFATDLQFPGLDVVDVAIASGVADYATSAGATGIVSFNYSGGDVLGADLSGEDFIRIELVAFDLANNIDMPVRVSLFDGAVQAILQQFVVVPGAQTLVFNYSDFANITKIDLSSIDRVAVSFSPGPATDFRIDEIIAIPEPATLCLLFVGAAAALRARRSRR